MKLHATIALLAMFMMSALTYAQKGTAEPGYYPIGYNGDIFAGEFVPSENPTEIKLLYTKGNKTEIFDGNIESPCHAPTKDNRREIKELHLLSIPRGTVLTVFYAPGKIKVGGKKVRTNLVWGIQFDSWNGQKLTNPNRPIILCSHQQSMPFRAFN